MSEHSEPEIEATSLEINAITFVVSDMARSLAFYTSLGLDVAYGDENATFASLRFGRNYINLSIEEGEVGRWGRVVFHVPSPDEVHRTLLEAGYRPSFEPRDAPWGERYFHVHDPDGHELSFACRLDRLDR